MFYDSFILFHKLLKPSKSLIKINNKINIIFISKLSNFEIFKFNNYFRKNIIIFVANVT